MSPGVRSESEPYRSLIRGALTSTPGSDLAPEPEPDRYGRLAHERHHRRESVGGVPTDAPQERHYDCDAPGRLTAINQPLHRESEANYLVGNGNGLPGESAFNEPRDFTDVQYWSDQSAQDLFFEEIRYDARTFGGASTTAHHGSLIQETVKAVRGRRPVVETYGYDAKLRLSTFRAHEVAASDAGAVATHPYALHAAADYTYDELSRPVTTRRSGLSAGATPAYGQFDNLTYRYDASGRPGGITDYASEPGGHPTGAAQTAAYVYNAAGDIEVDPYRQLRYEYNALGLASRIYVYAGPKLGTESLYYYTAGGALVESKTYDATRALVAHVYYLDGHRYDAVRDEVYYATRVGATVLDANNDARHIRYHHDHLGNVVLAYSDIVDPWLRPVADGRIDPRYEYFEEQQYFPYGMTRNGYTAGRPGLPFAYNGAEYSDALDLHLTTYRTMALETGLWGQVDPKAEAVPGMSPYTVNGANPISYSDPNGDLFFVFPHINIGSGGVSVGLEVGVGVPGVASASVTVGAGTGGAYASIQGTAVGFYAGYSTQVRGFAGIGIPIGGAYIGAGYSEAGGWGASAGIGGAPGRAQTSVGVGWSQNGGWGVNATVGFHYTGEQLKARFGKPGTTATASTDPIAGVGPEWDWNFNGAMDLDEAMWWWRWGNGEDVTWLLKDVDLSHVYADEAQRVKIEEKFAVSLIDRPGRDGSILGSISLKRVGESSVRAFHGRYDFDMQSWWSSPIRNIETLGARWLHGPGQSFWIKHPGTVTLKPRPGNWSMDPIRR